MSLTLSSLLNSLHTHLQTQTQLLPTLHAQLGLPATALEDELQSLQQNLMQSVESQIDIRRKQVEELLERCSCVEEECVRYGKALGGNAKVSGASLGEMRKELILPKRYDLVTKYQEKLRQIYHTKLEQLTTLTNKLSGLSHTLGPEFYLPDITEPALASGEDSGNSDANRDVTPERFSKLEKELVRGKGEVGKRLAQLSDMLVQIDFLYTELGIVPPALDDLPSTSSLSVTTSTSIPILRRSTSSSSIQGDPFLASVSTPTPSSGSNKSSASMLFTGGDPLEQSPAELEASYQRIFARFSAQIEEAESENLNLAEVALSNVDPTPGLLSWAGSLHDSLSALKSRREAHIQAMYDQLESLWRRLGVSEEDMDGFVEAHRGSTEEVVAEYEEELERMMDLKRERMGVFISNARDEIERLWDDMMIGKDERGDFAPLFDDEHTEELLTIHEDEIRRLKEERRLKAPLLASIKKYFDICEEEKELAAAVSDQSRLLGRGPRDPGRLLREEKMRKRVHKEKPRLEQDLLISIPAWEEDAGRSFLVHGQSILHILMQTASATDQENKKKPNSHTGSVPPRATTPVNSSNHYVPGSGSHAVGSNKGVVTPAVRPRSATGGKSNKRPRLGEAPSVGKSRTVLGTHRGNTQGQEHHPRKPVGPTKTPGGSLSRPRPITKSVSMSIPKTGTQHYALGHGRVPSGMAGYGQRSFSSSTARPHVVSAALAKKAGRARRESFKPRPSFDDWEHAHANRYGGFAGAVKEEEMY